MTKIKLRGIEEGKFLELFNEMSDDVKRLRREQIGYRFSQEELSLLKSSVSKMIGKFVDSILVQNPDGLTVAEALLLANVDVGIDKKLSSHKYESYIESKANSDIEFERLNKLIEEKNKKLHSINKSKNRWFVSRDDLLQLKLQEEQLTREIQCLQMHADHNNTSQNLGEMDFSEFMKRYRPEETSDDIWKHFFSRFPHLSYDIDVLPALENKPKDNLDLDFSGYILASFLGDALVSKVFGSLMHTRVVVEYDGAYRSQLSGACDDLEVSANRIHIEEIEGIKNLALVTIFDMEAQYYAFGSDLVDELDKIKGSHKLISNGNVIQFPEPKSAMPLPVIGRVAKFSDFL